MKTNDLLESFIQAKRDAQNLRLQARMKDRDAERIAVDVIKHLVLEEPTVELGRLITLNPTRVKEFLRSEYTPDEEGTVSRG